MTTPAAEEEHTHEYDGITELDNQLPRWWLLLFYFTIAFGVAYFAYYHIAKKGKLPVELYEAEIAAAAAPVAGTSDDGTAPTVGGDPAPTADGGFTVLEEPSTDEAILAEGKKIFGTHCFACHSQDGGGLVGPNMTDDYYIHGPTYADSMKVVINGVPEKGMISWKVMLKPDQIHAVCSYIWTLRGTTPKTPKAPEGTQHPVGG